MLGWVLQVLVGSWGHLLPAVGPGTARAHAHQRALLGRWPVVRVAAFNVGAVLLWAGLAGDRMPLIIGGAATVVGTLGLAVTLLAVGLRVSTEPAP